LLSGCQKSSLNFSGMRIQTFLSFVGKLCAPAEGRTKENCRDSASVLVKKNTYRTGQDVHLSDRARAIRQTPPGQGFAPTPWTTPQQ
ncbi:hypothetical protein V6253_25540, partial [Escherichia coli]|uniref:hypothetical protein n=1 Tax=Escherichia coli TaxID=562 RepID=UPI002FE53874